MILFFVVGILLGAISVVFVLQNTTIVTVTFLAWHLQGSLAVILFLAIASGVTVTLLLLLPGFIVDRFALRALRRQKKALEDDLTASRQNLAAEPAPASLSEVSLDL